MKTKKINLNNSQIPLHYQIADYLLVMLEQGELNHGSQVPPEEELKDLFGVSRTTVRHALDHLSRKGLIERKQGKGTFWTGSAQKKKQEKLSGINRQIFNITQKTMTRVLSKSIEKSSADLASFLRIPEGSDVTVFERIRFIHNEPMSYTINYLPAVYGKQITKKHLEKMTMLETLETIAGVKLGVVEHDVEITRASKEISQHLGIPALDPVLTVNTRVFTTGGAPVEIVWTYFVESKYKFRVVLEKEPGTLPIK